MVNTVLSLALLPLAVALFTRILVDDRITLPIRQKIVDRFGEEAMISYLAHCPRCASVWISGALTIPTVWGLSLPLWSWLLVFAATAQLAPMIVALGDRIEAGAD